MIYKNVKPRVHKKKPFPYIYKEKLYKTQKHRTGIKNFIYKKYTLLLTEVLSHTSEISYLKLYRYSEHKLQDIKEVCYIWPLASTRPELDHFVFLG